MKITERLTLIEYRIKKLDKMFYAIMTLLLANMGVNFVPW